MLRASSSLHRHAMSDVTRARGNKDVQSKNYNETRSPKRLSSDLELTQVAPLPRQVFLESDSGLLKTPLPPHKRVSAVSDDTANQQKRFSDGSPQSSPSTTPRKLKRFVGPWHLGRSLGHGASARVRLAEHTETHQLAAVKIISIKQATVLQTASLLDIDRQMRLAGKPRQGKLPMSLAREITILKSLNHENVIQLYDIWENRGELYLFTEFVGGGELFNYIKDNRPDEIECVRLFRQIITALAHCHRWKLCHRDLKPENILLDDDCNIKLADFGMATMQKDEHLKTACGSPHYAAPEVCRADKYVGELADLWSVGVVLYVMLFRALPFGQDCGADDVPRITREVMNADVRFPEGSNVSSLARKFIKKILRREPHRRLKIADMWNDDFLTMYEGYADIPENRDTWLGGPVAPLTVEDCGQPLRHKCEVDRGTVKGMCAVFQTDDDKAILKELLSPEPTYERAMYYRLKEHRELAEEKYAGENLTSSASDYHHMGKALQKSTTRSSLLLPAPPVLSRSESKLSIAAPVDRRPSNVSKFSHDGTGSVAATENSYDPFRSSKPQVAYDGDPYTKVDVQRNKSGMSKGSSTRAPRPVSRRFQQAASSVWESTVASSMSSIPSSPPVVRDEQGRLRTIRHTGPMKRALSTSSFGSSVSRVSIASGSQFVNRSKKHKRTVSFIRSRAQPPRPSNPTPLSQAQSILSSERLPGEIEDVLETIGERNSLPKMRDSRGPIPDGLRLASKAINSTNGARRQLLKLDDQATLASNELSHMCDEIWGPIPVPIACAGLQPTTDEILAARLRPTVIKQSTLREQCQQRLLPEPPFREPNALTKQRELLRLRDQLIKRSEELGSRIFENALKGVQLELSNNAPLIAQENYGRRVASAPSTSNAHGANTLGPLFDPNHVFQGHRHVSNPTTHHGLYSGQMPNFDYDGPSIQFVPKSPNVPTITCDGDGDPFYDGLAPDHLRGTNELRDIPRREGSREYELVQQRISMLEAQVQSLQGPLHTIHESNDIEDPNDTKRTSAGSKIKSWFKRDGSAKSLEKKPSPSSSRPVSTEQQVYEMPAATPVRASFQQPVDTATGAYHQYNGKRSQDHIRHDIVTPLPSFQGTHGAYESSEFPVRGESKQAANTISPTNNFRTKNFWDFLLRRRKRNKMTLIEPSVHNVSQNSLYRSSSNLYTTRTRSNLRRNPYPTLHSRRQPSEPVNWWYKILQVKPAKKILTLELHRGDAVDLIAATLKEWHRFGVRDVFVRADEDAKRIFARLDEGNSLNYRPVEIMIEFVALIYTEKKGTKDAGGMSVAYMEQMKGAKSSFLQCALQLEKLCREKGVWVLDEPRAKEMKKLYREWKRG